MSIDASQLDRMQRLSVQTFPSADGGISSFVLSLSGLADAMPAWDRDPVSRDRKLREFWPTEPWLAGAVYSLSARNAAFAWTLDGPPRTCARLQEMLHGANFGRGWTDLIAKISVDLFTQDNGAFIELIREGDSPSAAVVGVASLDAGRCQRTGNLEYPVVYDDQEGNQHKLKWYQVIPLAEFPSPVETMNGMQLCAVSRVLRMAQILRDVHLFQNEKVSGRNPGALHVVSGVRTEDLTNVLKGAAENADNKGLLRYQLPAVMGTVDPTAHVQLVTILLKSLPDGWDDEKFMKWYIALLALGFGAEYQDLAPLPGGGLGSSQQSTMLHLKAKGKGPEMFMKLLEHRFNFYGVMPRNVTFRFDEHDIEAEQIEAGVAKTRAETRQIRIVSGEITPEVARQIAEDDGDLKAEYVELLQADATPDTQVEDVEREPETDAADFEQTTDEEQSSKALGPDDYWARNRNRLEREMTADMERVLGEIGRRVERRLRQEVNASGIGTE